ncbi:restriction endonuclease subunit S [Halomonas sp. YLGW01]|uniref:restriction endonuclease subunit S n=1 Tax=Halomonas sp. YLGW01 TaxID=2773308 RepID=UPI00192E07CF|nr:restriction endonuclease subunit S [Halomonas sp. YLGW01]
MTNLTGSNLNRREAAGPKGDGRDSPSNFPKYPDCKDSGVEWLGKIPKHWGFSRLGFESWVRARLGWKGLKADEYVDDGYVFLSTPNIKGTSIDFEKVNYITKERFEESPEISLKVGDVLLAKDGSTLGTVNVVRHLPRPTTVNSSIAVITAGKNLYGLYLSYVFQSSFMKATIQAIKGGMGVPHLFQADLTKFYLPLPPGVEQSTIAAFLDHETARIDALVEEQQRLIALLKEKRQAVISHAVTKGLDPDVPMKDSGVEWLGEVPAHWDAIALRRILKRIEQGWSPECFNFPAEPDNWGVLKAGAVNNGVYRESENKALPDDLEPRGGIEVKVGDLIMCRASGSPDLIGSAAHVTSTRSRLMLSDKLFRLVLNDNSEPSYVSLMLGSAPVRRQIEQSINGAEGLANNLSQGSIKGLLITLPPVTEQQEIVARVHQEIIKLRQLLDQARRTVELLNERRSALISAAVTGKIDVRGWTPPADAAPAHQEARMEAV